MKKLVWAMLFLALSGNALAATLRIATITPENSQWMRDMRAGATEIEERTEGRVEIKLYGGGPQHGESAERVFAEALRWIACVHRLPIDEATATKLGCDELRRLNHEHIFSIPLLEPPTVALDDVCVGLDQASRDVRSDPSIRVAMSRLGEIYLAGQSDPSAERRLLHGDFYPGSWLRTDAGFRVIDPEFCFAGPVEFDLGVLSAHRIFCQSPADANE